MATTAISEKKTDNHPEYSALNTQCQKLSTVYECSDDLYSADFIHRHVFEDKKQYETRIGRAFTLSIAQNMIRKLVTHMFAGRVKRHGTDLASLRAFLADATGTNVSYEQFIQTLFASTILYGRSHVMVDYSYPEIEKELSGQIKQIPGTVEGDEPPPNLRLFTPMAMTNWNYVPRYGYEACVFKIEKLVDGQIKNWFLYVDYDTIEELDESGTVVNTSKHTLGYTPVFTMLNYDVNGSPMAFSNAIYKAQVAITNLCSITDEVAERHAFSQLTCPDDGTFAELAAQESDFVQKFARVSTGTDDIISGAADIGMNRVLRVMSQSSVFTFPAQTGHPPNFISPDATQLRNIWAIAKDVAVQTAAQIGLFDSNGNVSNVSSPPYFSGSADSMMAIERKILGTSLRYLNVTSDQFSVLYPNFEAPVDLSWMDFADRIAACTWLSTEAKAKIITEYVQAKADTLPLIDRSILDNAVKVQEPEPPTADNGNPKS